MAEVDVQELERKIREQEPIRDYAVFTPSHRGQSGAVATPLPAPFKNGHNPPTLESCTYALMRQVERLRDLAGGVRSFADKLSGPDNVANGPTHKPDHAGIVGEIDARIREADALINELVHDSGRIERALSAPST